MNNRRKGWDRWQIPMTALLLMVGMGGKGPAVNANPANFASLSLSPGFSSKTVKGYAKGAIALHRVVGERDMQRNMCLGYGSPSPDHVLVLTKKVNKLRLQVNSRRDTTLLIKGPKNRLYCLDDSAQGKDAGWIADQLPAGKYSIWVGAFERGQQFRYTVTVDEP
ncbi:hypothetical protein HRE53_18015 [Acaryochloris sp. 'Moss Beach']|uniref:hypothetical protein n=1 Tax=Acaryochloris sp. 'Moss Beach' TaxID=2740837 RepID=UPI001F2C7820|nr:hypothetical protein [Acaryochloris sp. 'Moss Beach']UJB68425.1 hypothetical protein HRE53_18015 [Acaryochloris sp. 'Moss Beach']